MMAIYSSILLLVCACKGSVAYNLRPGSSLSTTNKSGEQWGLPVTRSRFWGRGCNEAPFSENSFFSEKRGGIQ